MNAPVKTNEHWDFKYLSIEDLERMREHMQEQNDKRIRILGFIREEDRIYQINCEFIAAIDHEILERTVLGKTTDGGVSN